MEQPQDINLSKSIDTDTVEVHSTAVPGSGKETVEVDSSAVKMEVKKESAASQVEMAPLSRNEKHNIVNVKTGNCTIKTFRLDEDGNEKMVESKDFKEGENQVFYEKGFFYKIFDEKGNPLGRTSFTAEDLKKLNEDPQNPETQKMVMEKALRAQVDAIDNQANLEKGK
jgi:hypothetical protein